MVALNRYTIVVESEKPPMILLGDSVGGAVVTELKQVPMKLISSAELAEKLGISASTVRRKLAVINQGTDGKHLYDPDIAYKELTKGSKPNVGRKRAN